MATDTSFPGPGVGCSGSIAVDAALDVNSRTAAEDGDSEERAVFSSPSRLSFSISSILNDGAESPRDVQQTDGDRLTASTAVASPSRTDSKIVSNPLTFFYRDTALCPERSPGEAERSADALISSWSMPPTSPFMHRKYRLSFT